MSLEDDLVAAIAADPDDVGAQLVTADWLLELGDERGELIILDHRERTTPGGLIDPALIDRLLLLAAQYGSPCARPPEHGVSSSGIRRLELIGCGAGRGWRDITT